LNELMGLLSGCRILQQLPNRSRGAPHFCLLPGRSRFRNSRGILGELHLLVNNGMPDSAVPAHVYAIQEDAALNLTKTVNPYTGRQDAVQHPPAGDNAVVRDQRVDRHAHTPALFGEYEFCRRQCARNSANGPLVVVQVKHRVHAHQVHMGFVVGVQRAHISPVTYLLLVLIHEVVCDRLPIADNAFSYAADKSQIGMNRTQLLPRCRSTRGVSVPLLRDFREAYWPAGAGAQRCVGRISLSSQIPKRERRDAWCVESFDATMRAGATRFNQFQSISAYCEFLFRSLPSHIPER
jgi:hypothetical protein